MKGFICVLALLATTVPCLAADTAQATDRYKVLATTKLKTLRAELDQALADGYSVVGGNAKPHFVVLEKRQKPCAKKYRVEDRIRETVKKDDYKGFRILPWSFADYEGAGALLESLEDGEEQPEYKVPTTAYTRNLQKDLTEASAGGFRAIALSGGPHGQAALLQRSKAAGESPTAYELHATNKISTMEKEIKDAASRGFKVIAATGAGNEILVLMEKQEEGDAKRDYQVISTVRTSTFEAEINRAAASGYRIIPGTGAALQKGSMWTMGTYTYEQAIIMEKVPDTLPLRYMLLGATREGTVQRELNQTPAQCKIATMFLTYQELVTLLSCPAS